MAEAVSLAVDAVLEEDLDGTPVRWLNVLPLIDAAADGLKLGDLLSGECFCLHDAMSALELMDPQMDSGLTSSTVVEVTPSPPAQMKPADLIGLLDEMLCGEIGFYSGLPLALTVFRLDWLHAAADVVDPILRAVLLATIRTSAAVRVLVLRGDVMEEEDFTPSIYGLDMQDGLGDAELVSLLITSEEQTQDALKQAKERQPAAAAATNGDAVIDAKDATEGAEGVPAAAEECALLEAVLCRLRLRRGLFQTMSPLTKPGIKAVEGLKKALTFAQAQLAAIRTSMVLGTTATAVGCFTGSESRRLLGSAPQRKVELPTRQVAVDKIGDLLSQLRVVSRASDVGTYDGFVRWIGDACSCRPETSVVTKSYAQLAGVSEQRGSLQLRAPMGPMLWAAVGDTSSIGLDTWKQFAAIEPCREILDQFKHATAARFRLSCLNRARERRRLRRYLADWAPLQEMGDTLDMQLQRAGRLEPSVAPFGAWVFTQTLCTMLRFLVLGFELELYAPCEFRMIYWYTECVCNMRLQLHAAVQQAAGVQAAAVAAAASLKSASNKKKVKPPKVAQCSAAMRLELLIVGSIGELCRGLTALLSYLASQDLLPSVDLEFTSLEARYAARFAVFGTLLQPRVLPIGSYLEVVEIAHSQLDPAELLDRAAACFRAAKTATDRALQTADASPSAHQRAELIALARVAVANGVVVAMESKRQQSEEKRRATFSFSAHPSFACVGLQRI